MNNIIGCIREGIPHTWISVFIPKSGFECFSCPSCGQVIFWDEFIMEWVRKEV